MVSATVEEIKNNVIEWTEKNIGKDFQFRPNQLDAIVYIINNILNNNVETSVIQAPTGTGKSLICIISAGVLAQYYEMKSYILASDLYLWQQYMSAISKYKLKDFGYLKGSIGNYRCDVSHVDYNIGKCKINKVSLSTLRNKDTRYSSGYRCADTCLYMRHRFRAEKTPVTLLTYQLWLYQMNLVDHSDNQGFLKRDVIFCDECHNIPDIVEKYAQPVIDVHSDRKKIQDIVQYAIDNNLGCVYSADCLRPDVLYKLELENSYNTSGMRCADAVQVSRILENYDYFINCLHITEHIDTNRSVVKLEILRDFYKTISFVADLAERSLEFLKSNQDSTIEKRHGLQKQSKEDINNFKTLSWMHNYSSMLSEFIKSASAAGHDYIVIEEVKDRINGSLSYTLNCVKEDYLCYNYLLKNAKYKVMTSATVGNKNAYMDNIGTKYTDSQVARFIDIPNFFDFSKSPIYFIPKYKMSYREKARDFPEIQKIIFQILSSPQYANQRGMINTGSYENAKAIYDNAPVEIRKRLCMYISSKDKNEQIEKYTNSKNKVLIGPTLVEGVDLPNDLCRFIIIAKVPYPNIGSKTVKAKMDIFPLWYNSTTSNTIIQNIGRGVRNENDYCTTFILDGCFKSLYESTYDQYPQEIKDRIKFLNC